MYKQQIIKTAFYCLFKNVFQTMFSIMKHNETPFELHSNTKVRVDNTLVTQQNTSSISKQYHWAIT